MKITIELKNEDEQDKKIIDFIIGQEKIMKKVDLKHALPQNLILKHLVNMPTELHKQKIRKDFLSAISEEAKLDLIYKSYAKEKSLSITLADFSLNHLSKIKNNQRMKYLNEYNN